MHEGEDPGARLRPFRTERRRAAPDREEPLLHCVLREPLVPQHANGKPVGDAPHAVVQLSERAFVAASDERNQGLVGQVSVTLAHWPAWLDCQR